MIGFIQFTSTAALLAGAGYFYFIIKNNNHTILIFLLAEFLAFLLRSNAMLMIQPFGIAVLFGVAFAEGELGEKEKRYILGKSLMGLLVLLGVGTVGNGIAYSGEEWIRYKKGNQARIELFDYYGTPDYEEVQEILYRYQVTRTEYEAYCCYIMPDWNVSPECAEELADYVKEKGKSNVNLEKILYDVWVNMFQEESLAPNQIVSLVLGGLIIWLLLTKRFTWLMSVFGWGVAHTIVWGYIYYKGRIVNRVSYPIWACEVLMLIAIWGKVYLKEKRLRWEKALILCMCVLMIYQGYQIGQRQYRYIKSVNESQEIFVEGLREIEDYCRSKPEEMFFLDNVAFSYYKGSALETAIYEPINAVYTGGWNANRPALRAYLKEGIENRWEGFSLIVLDDGRSIEEQIDYVAVRFFEEQTGKEAELKDELQVSHGGKYLVWKF